MQSVRKSNLLTRSFNFHNSVRLLTCFASAKPCLNLEPKPLASPPKTFLLQNRFKSSQALHATQIVNGFPPMGLTENQSPTYVSTGNPCLDFFFQIVPGTSSSDIVRHLEGAWDHDPLTTLKLICNLRGVKGTGKSDKEGFYTAALWLHENHHKNLACNVSAMASFGYLKDMLEILFRLIEGEEARAKIQEEWKSTKGRSKEGEEVEDDEELKESRALVPRERRVETNEAKMRGERERASILRKETRLARSEKLRKLYASDMYFQFLYEKISSLFADMLKADMECFNSGKMNDISLAAKWCPSLDSSYDKYTLICGSIAKKVFPCETYPEYEGIEDAHYQYRVRDRLRKQVLVPLREVLQLPEVFMSANKWSSVSYNRVASVAMKNYTDIFMSNDKDRFSKYLEDVKEGKKKIAAGSLLPHDIIRSCLSGDSEGQKDVAELQWKRMVDDMLEKGKLSNSIAICDVSGSMEWVPSRKKEVKPLEVSVALGLLVSELSEEPWKGQVITFSKYPELHLIKGNTLKDKCEFIEKLQWQVNTDFQKVLDQILKVAVAAELSEEQMVKRVFVFSDMEFDEASLNPWETDYQAIQRKFKEKGYEKVPEIVFWNLRPSRSTPVTAKQSGVALLSGFSKNLLTLFLNEEKEKEITPEIAMELAISGKEYEKLALYDD